MLIRILHFGGIIRNFVYVIVFMQKFKVRHILKNVYSMLRLLYDPKLLIFT